MKNWTTRHLVTLAVFGALWGVAEMSLGAVLHALKLPLTGLIMSGIGMLVALTGYRLVPRRGAVLTIGIVAALLKAFSVGSVVFSPMLAIVTEALLAELALALGGGQPRRVPMAIAGALAGLWSFCHPFVGQGLLGGKSMVSVYSRMIESGAKLLHMDPSAVAVIIAALVLLHLVGGAVAGMLAFGLGNQLARRLRAGVA